MQANERGSSNQSCWQGKLQGFLSPDLNSRRVWSLHRPMPADYDIVPRVDISGIGPGASLRVPFLRLRYTSAELVASTSKPICEFFSSMQLLRYIFAQG